MRAWSTQAGLTVAATADNGKTWTKAPLHGSNIETVLRNYAGRAYLSFPDAAHGWLMLKGISSSNFSYGDLYSTANGGKSWTHLPNPPIADQTRFISEKIGWIAGGPGGNILYRTQNGGNTWTAQNVKLPPAETPERTFYSLPLFTESESDHGVLPVLFEAAESSGLALYQTTDNGQSWQLQSSESGLPVGTAPVVASAGSSAIRLYLARKILRVGPVGSNQSAQGPSSLSTGEAVSSATFSDKRHGWAVIQESFRLSPKADYHQSTYLWATEDGGRTFADHTPPQVSPVRIDTVPASPTPPPVRRR